MAMTGRSATDAASEEAVRMGQETINPPVQPTVIAPTRAKISNPMTPQIPGGRAGQNGSDPRKSTRRPSSDQARQRTTVTAMVVNLDASRVALMTTDGPPYRGDINTDLVPGVYSITADPQAKRWVFEPRQVKSGLRFDLTIDGPDPFALSYAPALLLTVSHGLDGFHFDTLGAAVGIINAAVSDYSPDRWADALDYLCMLSLVDLYDLIDELEATHAGVAGVLRLGFQTAAKLSDTPGQAGVLRALESFTRTPAEIYIDAFDTCQMSPASFTPDPERARAGLSPIQLVLTYDIIAPVRALTVYAADITDDAATEATPPTYGPLDLTYPTHLSLGTTPKLHAAKKAAMDELHRQNAEFFVLAFKVSANVLLGVYQATLSIAKIEATSSARGYTPRAERGPGQWRDTFEGGSNMREGAAVYEGSSCGTPRGMGYYVDNVQFEGFKSGKLLDAKFWQANGRMANLMRTNPWAAEASILKQSSRQLAVAGKYGVGVQWRVADPGVADMLRNFMQAHGLPIEIIFIAP